MVSFKNTFLFSMFRYYYKNHLSFRIFKQKLLFKNKLEPEYAVVVQQLKINGFAKIPHFFSKQDMQLFKEKIIANLDALDEKHKSETSSGLIMYEQNSKCIKKEYGYSRLFDLLKINPNLDKFINNSTIKNIVSAYYGRESYSYHNLAQKSMAIENCGLDWHIDDYLPRFKALIYLHDVALADGPFSMLKGSHKSSFSKLKRIHKMYVVDYYKESVFPHEEIDSMNFEQIDCVGKEGDLFLVDVGAIHRGLPVQFNHSRYAIFNFYSPDRLK